jgi:N-acetylneuraminic acid mutarotase
MQDLWRFNIETFQWIKVARPPERATSVATFVISGKAYVFGGLTYSNGNGDSQLWEYNPQTNQWAIKTSMPGTKRYWPTTVVYNNKAYVAGGTVNGYGSTVPQEM